MTNSMVVLDRKLTASQARVSNKVRQILTSLITEAVVKVYHEFFYLVDFDPGVYPQLHIVSHDLYCACVLEADCPAVTAVKVYLHRGIGSAANKPCPGYFPAAPHFCLVCGARAFYEPRLSSHHRGIGWQCSRNGAVHYWQHQGMVPRVACPV